MELDKILALLVTFKGDVRAEFFQSDQFFLEVFIDTKSFAVFLHKLVKQLPQIIDRLLPLVIEILGDIWDC